MWDDQLRVWKDVLLLPLAQWLGSWCSPNSLTVAALFAGLASAAAAAAGFWGWALFLWGVNRLLDGLDGAVARACHRQSDWGGYLDIVCDFAVYALIPLGATWGVAGGGSSHIPFVVVALLEGVCFVNAAGLFMLSALLERKQWASKGAGAGVTTVAMPRGLVEGFETIIAFSLFLMFPSHVLLLQAVFTALVATTVVLRLVRAKSLLA